MKSEGDEREIYGSNTTSAPTQFPQGDLTLPHYLTDPGFNQNCYEAVNYVDSLRSTSTVTQYSEVGLTMQL